MLSSMMRHQFGKGGRRKKFRQNMLSSMIQFLVKKSAVKNQDRKTFSVARRDINLGKEEPEKISTKYAQ